MRIVRRFRRWRNDLIWKARGRGAYWRPMKLNEIEPASLDAAKAYGRELAARYGWAARREQEHCERKEQGG